VRRSFWLNRKGRIDADLRVLNLQDRVLLEVDALVSERTRAGLDSFIIGEDCAIKDRTQETHRLALHGPTAWDLLKLASGETKELQANECGEVSLAGAACVVYREDSAGVPGFELIVPADAATRIVGKLIELGHDAAHATFEEPGRAIALRQAANPATTIRLQPIGWYAYNLARVEHGTPLFNVDFGAENLPAETGVLADRVSFTKGCYLGQEVVARMHARGQSKQTLVAVRFARPASKDGQEQEGYPPLPESGAALGTIGADGALMPIGTITSAVPSPMLGMSPVAFAQVRTASAVAGTVVVADAEGVRLTGTIQPTLNLWPGAAVRSNA
jgi:folate-binding protein YgfZ